MIDFPASPTLGQQFTAAGVTWTWDGTKWLPSGLSPTVVPGINDNRIINGDMRIDQRNNGASGTLSPFAYTVDRWAYQGAQPSKGTWGRANTSWFPFPYALSFSSSTAYASIATDYFRFLQYIEADMVTDFGWGTSYAQPATLSFYAYSTLSGTFSGSVTNYTGTRSYPFTYVLTASQWGRITVTIPVDTTGAWVMTGNAASMVVSFDLGGGSNFRGPANAWASANYTGVTGSVSIVGTNGAAFYVTGVKLEIGSVATPYNRQSLAKSMADCQRYYEIGSEPYFYTAGVTGITGAYGMVQFQTIKRATPTMTFNAWKYYSAGTNTACVPSAGVITPTSGGFIVTGATTWQGWDGSGNWSASAEL